MRRGGFTLVELMAVIAIMGMMGVVSIGGYRAMRRGMEERSVMQNVNQFVRSAYQRAQIDRLPVDVYFWNETLVSDDDPNEPPVAVGRAVAVRQSGRISKVQGSKLYDEFGDLKYSRLVFDEDASMSSQSSAASASGSSSSGGVNLYSMKSGGSSPKRSVVASMTVREESNERLLLGDGIKNAHIEAYAYEVIDDGGVGWKSGEPYGFEFAELTLPRGYLFGGTWSRSAKNPVAGEQRIRFKVGVNSGSGATQGTDGTDTVAVYSLRPGAGGDVDAQEVAVSDSPAKRLSY